MKKLLLLMVITLILAACGQTKGTSDSDSKKETVTVNQKYELRGKYKDGRDAEQKDEKVKITKDPKKSLHLITVQQTSLKHSVKKIM